jgi:hypothetical protein
MFVKKGEKGHRKLGPIFIESTKWPGQNREFPELSPNYDHEDSRGNVVLHKTFYNTIHIYFSKILNVSVPLAIRIKGQANLFEFPS